MDNDDAFAWVLRNMPEESDRALLRFTEKNPHWRGAHWDDCLEVLFETDGDLEVTEPLYEEHPDVREWNDLPAAIALTLAWASIDFYTAGHDRQYEIVMEWIRKDAT